MNGLAELAGHTRSEASTYAELVGRYGDVTLRFSKQVARPLPPTLAGLRKLLAAVYLPLAMASPKAADRSLALERRPDDPKGWTVSIARTHERDWCPGYFEPRGGSESLAERTRARRELEPVLIAIERDWLAHRKALWLSLTTAEGIANQLLDVHLLQCETRLAEAKADYVGDEALLGAFFKDPADIARQNVRVKNDPRKRARFESLLAALLALRARRKALDIDTLERQRSVLQGAAVAASLVPVAVAASASLDAPEAIEALRELAGDAAGRSLAALLDYVAEMRRLAGEHPILIVIHQVSAEDDESFTEARVIRTVLAAVEQVGEAIAELSEVMQEPVVPAPLRVGTDRETAPGAQAMTDAIAASSKLGVWKLPFFIDTALHWLPEDERMGVTGLRTTALDQRGEELLAREMILTTLETATMLLPQARMAALVLSFGLGLVRLTGALKSYDEATTLFHASMDPAFLVLGDAGHQPAHADMILLDLAFLMLDAAGVGKALGR